jgi:hypothetical protein
MIADSSGRHAGCVHAICGQNIVLLVTSKLPGLEVYHRKDIHIYVTYKYLMSRIQEQVTT